MKKLILPIAVLMFGLSHAQETEKKESSKSDIKVGVKFGMNVSTIAGDGENIDPAVAFHGGAVVEFPVSEKFSVQPELVYSMQGAKSSGILEVDGTPYNVKEHLKLSYLNIPVMAKYYVTPEFSVLAGPQLGFLTSAKDKIKFDDGEGNSGSDNVDVKDVFKSIDVAFGFGLGYSFIKQINAEIRYNVGLSNIADDGDSNMQNNVLQVSLGFRFN